MKTRYSIITALTALLVSAACQKEAVFQGTPELEGGGIVLNFTAGPQSTKTTMAGDDDYNENTLTTIDYFLYPEGQTGNNAYVKGHVTLSGRTSYNVLVNTSQLATLFSGAAVGSHCDVYAIANYPGETSDFNAASDTTSLRALLVSKQFQNNTVQDDFVMSGHAVATVINKNQKKAAEGTVPLNRSASKITFECKVAPSVTITNYIYSDGVKVDSTDVVWVPITTGMNAYLVNGLSEGTVGGDEAEKRDPAIYRYGQRLLTDADSDGWYTCDPFYSYPQSWSTGDENEPFIKLVVPWAYLNEHGQQAGQKQFYYKVPCPGLSIAPNTWYHIRLDVAILGGDDFEAMLEVNGEYYVVPWNTQTIVEADAEIKDARYISAPSRAYDMFNITRMDVVITSSSDSELNLKSVYYYDYVNETNTNYTSTARNNNWITYNDETRTFTINHTLNNDITNANFDSSPYVFTFEIRHTDNYAYTTGDIVVTQYPAMFISELQSNKYAFLNGTGNSATQEVTGYDSNSTSLSTLPSRNSINDSGDNTNSHMYRIRVTSVSGLDYTIGDPRLWAEDTVTDLDGLTDYMPAAEINDHMIAPEFMVASSIGKTKETSYEVAQRRCAAYQENGFPAGRWRVPTKSEIMFLIQLSEKDKIPTLFTPDRQLSAGGYWCSSGVVYPLTSGTVEYRVFSEAASIRATNWVRCIYDTWYWGTEPDSDHLTTWGGYQTTH